MPTSQRIYWEVNFHNQTPLDQWHEPSVCSWEVSFYHHGLDFSFYSWVAAFTIPP